MEKEQEKILKLLEFLSSEAIIELEKDGIIIKNFKYSTNIKLESLPDWNFKVEFAVRNNRNQFKKLNENLGECFVLPYEIVNVFLGTLTQEIIAQNNKELIKEHGYTFFKEKIDEVLTILNMDKKIDEEFQFFTLCHENEKFNNVMIIDKPNNEENKFLGHEYIKIRYSYLINIEDEIDPICKVENLNVYIPALEIKKFHILNKCFSEPIKNNYESLIEILKETNKDENMNKLLVYTNLSEEFKSPNIKKEKKNKI